jgi:hypothetical protein
MTWPRDGVEWLREQFDEALVSMGYVGLYEAIWSLNSSPFDLDERQKRRLARSVAEELLAVSPLGPRLCLLTWPGAQIVSAPLPLSTLDDDASWEVSDRFVALVQPDLLPGPTAG